MSFLHGAGMAVLAANFFTSGLLKKEETQTCQDHPGEKYLKPKIDNSVNIKAMKEYKEPARKRAARRKKK